MYVLDCTRIYRNAFGGAHEYKTLYRSSYRAGKQIVHPWCWRNVIINVIVQYDPDFTALPSFGLGTAFQNAVQRPSSLLLLVSTFMPNRKMLSCMTATNLVDVTKTISYSTNPPLSNPVWVTRIKLLHEARLHVAVQ